MKARPRQRGWAELDALPARTPSRDVIVDLKEPTSLLLLKDGQVSHLRVTPAPDGEYDLQHSGKVVVQNGQVREVVGIPDAPAVSGPAP
jgi:hypothetical protein